MDGQGAESVPPTAGKEKGSWLCPGGCSPVLVPGAGAVTSQQKRVGAGVRVESAGEVWTGSQEGGRTRGSSQGRKGGRVDGEAGGH